jgi:hypothetical protein
MKGILEQPQKTAPAPQPGGMLSKPAAPAAEQPAENPVPDVAVDPKLQEQMDILTANGIRMIHNKKLSGSLIKSITNAEDPVDAIADSTVAIIDRIEASAKQNNLTPDFGVLAQSANILMGEIIQIAELSGVPPLSDEDKYRAYSLAVSKYIDDAVKAGRITTEQLQQMADQAKQTPEGQKIMAQAGMDQGASTTGKQPQAPDPSASAPPPPSQPPTGTMPAGMPQRRM